MLKIPPHLAYVVTLPCETLMCAKQAVNDKLQSSVATYLRCGGVVNEQIKKGLLLSLRVKKNRRMFGKVTSKNAIVSCTFLLIYCRPLVHHTNHQALSTARFRRACLLATADSCVNVSGSRGDTQVPACRHHSSHGDRRQREHGAVDCDQVWHPQARRRLPRPRRTRIQRQNPRVARRTGKPRLDLHHTGLAKVGFSVLGF